MTPISRSMALALLTISMSFSCALAQSPKNNRPAQFTIDHGYNYAQSMSRSMVVTVDQAPVLQGATMGTIGPQGTDVTMIQGIMTAGTVRVNNLANLEALLNILANTALVLGHLVGIWYLVKTIRLTVKTPGNVLGGTAKGLTFISVGLLSPDFVNWAVAMARDAALFN